MDVFLALKKLNFGGIFLSDCTNLVERWIIYYYLKIVYTTVNDRHTIFG